MVAAISNQTIIYSMIISGAYTSQSFVDFLQQFLNQRLFTRNHVIVMDNAKIHDAILVKNFFTRNKLTLMYLPPYSPSLNPIEEVFVTLKSRYHKRRPKPTDSDSIIAAVNAVITKMNDNPKIILDNYYRYMKEFV